MATTIAMSEVFNALASQLGIDIESQDIKNVLSDKRLTEVQLPEEVANKFKTGFLTVQAGKNNAELNAHFKVKHLKGVENRLKQELKKQGIPEDILNEMTAIPEALGQIEFIAPKLHEHYKSVYDKGTTGDEKYQELVGKYNSVIKEKEGLVTSLASEKQNWIKEKEGIELNYEINSTLGQYQFSDIYQPEDVKLLVQKKLSEKPYVFKKVDGQIGVYQKENPDLKATKNNKELTVKNILDEVVQPYMKKNGSTTPPATQHNIPPPATGNQNTAAREKLLADIERAKQLREGKNLPV